jgi:hypothetical protein
MVGENPDIAAGASWFGDFSSLLAHFGGTIPCKMLSAQLALEQVHAGGAPSLRVRFPQAAWDHDPVADQTIVKSLASRASCQHDAWSSDHFCDGSWQAAEA